MDRRQPLPSFAGSTLALLAALLVLLGGASVLPAEPQGVAPAPAPPPAPAPAADASAPQKPARAILVTVDDLPLAGGDLHARPAERRRIIRDLLAVLARHRVPAVGFVTWDFVRGRGDLRLLARWLAAGHELGNHTGGHLNYVETAPEPYVADAERGRSALAAFLVPRGRRVRFFRFPFLLEGDTPGKLAAMRDYLGGSGQRNLPVTVAFEDWKYEEPWVEARRRNDRAALEALGREYRETFVRELGRSEELSRRLFGHSVPQVLLLHANEVGTAQWEALFTHLARQGYRFVAADEALAHPAFAEPHRFVSKDGPILWERLDGERRQDDAGEGAAGEDAPAPQTAAPSPPAASR